MMDNLPVLRTAAVRWVIDTAGAKPACATLNGEALA
jgi:hypothetical protein